MNLQLEGNLKRVHLQASSSGWSRSWRELAQGSPVTLVIPSAVASSAPGSRSARSPRAAGNWNQPEANSRSSAARREELGPTSSLSFFICRYLFFPTAFVEKTILSLWMILASLLKITWPLYNSLFWGLLFFSIGPFFCLDATVTLFWLL